MDTDAGNDIYIYIYNILEPGPAATTLPGTIIHDNQPGSEQSELSGVPNGPEDLSSIAEG